MRKIKVLILTSSFPITEESVSGIFIKRLVDSLPSVIDPIVVTPNDDSYVTSAKKFEYKVEYFNYAPRKFRKLAHKPGGIPAALESNKLFFLLVPFFWWQCFLRARSKLKK